MPSDTRMQHLWRSFTKRRGSSAKLTRIQRRARDLMSISSVLAFCTILAWLLIGMALVLTGGASATKSSSSLRLLEHWHMMPTQPFDMPLLALACLLAFVAALAPIVCLRGLGKALYNQPPLSFIVGRRFLWLGHALVVNIVVGWIAAFIFASQIKQHQLSFSLGFWGTFIAAILAYVVAEIIREGALAAKENREFV